MVITGGLVDYAVVFGAGVLVSLTPCVYPLVPVVAASIAGVNVSGRRRDGFVLSMIYVSGLAVVYALLAMMAALTGSVFGLLQNDPRVLLVIANIFLFFALVLLDVIPLPVVRLWTAMRPGNGWGVFVMGAASGFLVGPCTAPALGALLAYVAAKQNMFYAASLLVTFAYGLGASLIVVGTFGGALASWPKSGAWMVAIKKAAGFILLGFAEYYLLRAGGLS